MSTITLPNIRVSSDLTVSVRLKDNGVAIDWSTLNNVKASIYSDAQRALAGRCDVSVDAEDPTVLVCQYAANKPQYVGVCRIVVSAKYMGETKTYDKPAFNFVRWTADQDGEQITIDDPDVDVEIDVADVSSSLLDEAIRAAFNAAEEAVDAKGQVLETEAEVEAAEALRVSAEESRVEAEEGRVEAEAARVDEEAVRVSAEDARVVAENARAAAEDLREGAEDDRAAAETARETAEAARVAAEALRVSAESSRETAEAAREAQASADHTVAAGDHTQAAADHAQAAADHTTAASDHTQAGADHTLAAADHVTAGEDHAQAQDDHEVMAGYDTRLGNVEGEVSQLEAKVDEIEPEVEQLKTGNYTEEAGTEQLVFSNELSVAQIYAPANATVFAGSEVYNAYYYKATKSMLVNYRVRTTLSHWHIVITEAIPAVGGSYVGVAKNVASGDTGSFQVSPGQYICVIAYYGPATNSFPVLTAKLYETINVVSLSKSLRNHRLNDLAPTYFHGVRLVDTMTKQLWGLSTATKIGNFTPVSATADTITLSSEDAACIVNTVILSCKFANGNYKNIYFSAASGNVITKLYDFGENLDCQNIVQMQSLHDTINGGSGIHLSPFGYRSMAQTIVDKLNTKQPFGDVFVGGWSAQFCLGSTGYTDSTIRDANGVTICSPVTTGISVGGATNKCEMRYTVSISQSGPLYRTFYDITQTAPNGATVLFHIPSLYPFKGFLRINCARQPGNNGTASFAVKDFDGNTIVTKSIPYYADSYIIPLEDKYYEGVDVLISLPDNAQTKVMITEMTLHETYVELPQIRPMNSKSLVALLGSSNTQFPSIATAEALCPGDTDNQIVVRPDGTEGDGCGYLGKELARASGATVDNWGKSGEQTPYGLDIIQKVFATKRYTHIVLSLFANDINASRPMAETITNIRQMVEYAKGQGAIPIVIMGYATNTGNAVMRYALMYDDLSQGMDSPFIYTSAELHSA